MPLISLFYATLSSDLVVVIYGIAKEKHYVPYATAVVNIMSALITLASIDLPFLLENMVADWAIIGLIATYSRDYRFVVLFGCKTYGSLLLVLWAYGYGYLTNLIAPWYSFTQSTDYAVGLVVVLSWILVALVVNLIGLAFSLAQYSAD